MGQNKTVNIEKKNDNVNLRNLKEILVSWRNRKLPIFGKCQLIKFFFDLKGLVHGFYFRKTLIMLKDDFHL